METLYLKKLIFSAAGREGGGEDHPEKSWSL